MNRRRVFFIAFATVFALAAAACGSSSGGGSGTNTSASGGGTTAAGGSTTTANNIVSKTLGTGVTDKTIKIGISLIDFKCIAQFIDFTRPNQEVGYRAFIDDINKKGGINGRTIEPVFKTECPINPTSDLQVQICTGFTEDEKVFAVLGNISDAAQDDAIHTCITKKHHTPLITYNITQAMINDSPPGLLVFPGTTPERSSTVLFKLLEEKGTLKGKKVAILANSTSEPSVKASVIPGLKRIGVDMGTTAFLTINGPDTTAAHSQLSSFIEKWKSEGVNALFVTSEDAVAKQFVEQVVKGLPQGLILMTDVGDASFQAQDEVKAKANPNPYEGMYYAGGYSAHDYDLSDNWKYCSDIYKAQTGKEPPNAEAQINIKVDGKEKRDDTYGNVNDACEQVSLFAQIVQRMGAYPNADNWIATVNTMGKVIDRGGGPYASLHTGKYDMGDTFVLQQFSSTEPPQGNWKNVGTYQNISS
jgi:ABC-type branched-subunit amino acid transport system substrate-binding protein